MKIRVEVAKGGSTGKTETAVREYEGEEATWKYKVVQDIIDFLQRTLGIIVTPSTEPRADERYYEIMGDLERRGDLTLRERLEWFLRVECPREWYTSVQVKNKYEQTFHERINLSTVSTYLARMHRDDLLERRGNRRQREYRVAAAKTDAGKVLAESPLDETEE